MSSLYSIVFVNNSLNVFRGIGTVSGETGRKRYCEANEIYGAYQPSDGRLGRVGGFGMYPEGIAPAARGRMAIASR